MDVVNYNREAWDKQVAESNPWTIPVTPEQIAAARQGQWSVVLTATLPVPLDWFPELKGCDVLCLASGGGQQGPILAAAGANVTVFDNSPAQLSRDQEVSEREGLNITTVQGDMRDLSGFADQSFDLVFHPVSNLFAPEVLPVWKEAYRVLRQGGRLLAGFLNPDVYIFEMDKAEAGEFEVKFPLPYSDIESLTGEGRQRYLDKGWPLEYSHSMDEQIGGQVAAGFVITGFYQDTDEAPIGSYIPRYYTTRAVKL